MGAAWPEVDRADVTNFARIGRLFWFTSCVAWETWALETPWVSRLRRNLPLYERQLGAALDDLGWQ